MTSTTADGSLGTTDDDNGGGSSKPVFDTAMAGVYSHFAKQHHHPDGPYNKITERVIQAASTMSSPITIVDLASGHGEPASLFAKRLPDATVYSTDISEVMHALAAQAATVHPNMHAKIADMQDLSPLFDDDSVDIVTSCYGYMFPPDKMKALQETLRVLKPGGFMIATTWDRIQFFEVTNEVLSELLGEQYPPSPAFDPLSLREEGLFERMVAEAGFDQQSIEASTARYPMDVGSDPNFHVAMVLSADSRKLLGSIDPDRIKEVYAAVAKKHLVVQDDGVIVSTENVYKCVVARKKESMTTE